jgi:hypothetical protein
VYGILPIYNRVAIWEKSARMKLRHFLTGPMLLFGVCIFLTTALHGSDSILPNASSAIAAGTISITSDDGNPWVNAARETDLIGINPNQVVHITINFCAGDCARDVVLAEPLDGGRILGKTNGAFVDSNGCASFLFQAGPNPGAAQIRVTDAGTEVMAVRLWVIDPDDPGNHPLIINN